MEENLSINLVDAKNEYTSQLISILYLSIYEGIASIYDDAKILHENDPSNSTLKNFQNLLCLIPKWDKEMLDSEVDRIILKSKCEWVEDLLTAVFISHTKILSSITKSDKSRYIYS